MYSEGRQSVVDFESMTDLEIKRYKTKLYWLRKEAAPAQAAEISAEMRRGSLVINARQRERAIEAMRIARETPGAISATVIGPSAGAGARTPRG